MAWNDNSELRENGHAASADVTSVRFFPSGALVLTASTDLSLKIW
jgi:WD40 repeat protein